MDGGCIVILFGLFCFFAGIIGLAIGIRNAEGPLILGIIILALVYFVMFHQTGKKG